MSFPNLGPAEFKAAFEADENAVVLDVRTPDEIAEGKIEGAIELNFFDDNFQQEVLKLDANKSYYIYCRSGRRSANACAFLAQKWLCQSHEFGRRYDGLGSSQSIIYFFYLSLRLSFAASHFGLAAAGSPPPKCSAKEQKKNNFYYESCFFCYGTDRCCHFYLAVFYSRKKTKTAASTFL